MTDAAIKKELKALLPVQHNYPKPGVSFVDVNKLFLKPYLLEKVIKMIARNLQRLGNTIDYVAGPESRGFALGALLAQELKVAFIPIRKGNAKLPGDVLRSSDYDKEYSGDAKDSLQVQVTSASNGQMGVVFDDVLATGGTARTAVELMEALTGIAPIMFIALVNVEVAHIEDMCIRTHVYSVLGESDYPFPESNVQRVVCKYVSPHDSRTVLYATPTCQFILNQYINDHPNHYRAGFVDWGQFPDGSPNVKFDERHAIQGRPLVLFMDLTDYATVSTQIQFAIALNRQLPASLTVVVPFLPTGTMERVDKEGTLATGETLLKELTSSFESNAGGLPRIVVYDIHATAALFFADSKSVTMVPKSFIQSAAERLLVGRPTIVFPDSGALSRFGSVFEDRFRIVVFSKIRDGDKRTLCETKRINVPKGMTDEELFENVTLVDDLVQSGRTAYEAYLILRNKYKARRVTLLVTHPVFPQDCWREFLPNGSMAGFDSIVVSDSIPRMAQKLRLRSPFVVIPLKDSLHPFLIRGAGSRLNPVDIYLSSTSPIKIDAVQRAVYEAGYLSAFDLHTVDVQPATIGRQPWGEQTLVAAKERHKELIRKTGETTSWPITIESGLFEVEPGRFKDGVVFIGGHVILQARLSKEIDVPVEVTDKLVIGDMTKTAGDVIHEMWGFAADNWQGPVSGTTRTRQIVNAINMAKKVSFKHLDEITFDKLV